MNFRPNASCETLRARAKIIAKIRYFFAERNILEVETPLLCRHTVTDPHVLGVPAICMTGDQEQIRFLQTSPEYAMKRLLASDIGSIYQISKAFRQGDLSKKHNPEFTLLEWYRIGYDHLALMDEVDAFLQFILNTKAADRFTYQEVYEHFLNINPHTVTIENLKALVKVKFDYELILPDKNAYFDLLFTHFIELQLGKERPFFIYDFPAPQACLAKIRPGNPPLASRFEVYFKGVELANGFHELTDAHEQRERFKNDLTFRKQQGLPSVEIDEKFIAALAGGLPECAGVALGVDRLVMLALNKQSISEVLSFSFENA